MARTKIDYGIDLGTTNSAISRMENGEPTIKKTDTLKDTMPSCVYINKKYIYVKIHIYIYISLYINPPLYYEFVVDLGLKAWTPKLLAYALGRKGFF